MAFDADFIFVLGGPGAGKGTQCKLLCDVLGSYHLSIGDMLRAEAAKPDSEHGVSIRRNMQNGRVGPMEITLDLLRKAIAQIVDQAPDNGNRSLFCIDGFPRKLDQAELFESTISSPLCVVDIQCPEHVLLDRLHLRAQAQGRSDDNADTISRRISTYQETTKVVLDHYERIGKVIKIDGTGTIQEVHSRLKDRIEQSFAAKWTSSP